MRAAQTSLDDAASRLTDVDVAGLALMELKRIAGEYLTAMFEAADPEVRQQFERGLHRALQDYDRLRRSAAALRPEAAPVMAAQEVMQSEMRRYGQAAQVLHHWMDRNLQQAALPRTGTDDRAGAGAPDRAFAGGTSDRADAGETSNRADTATVDRAGAGATDWAAAGTSDRTKLDAADRDQSQQRAAGAVGGDAVMNDPVRQPASIPVYVPVRGVIGQPPGLAAAGQRAVPPGPVYMPAFAMAEPMPPNSRQANRRAAGSVGPLG